MITHIRMYSQQLVEPVFDTPRELVKWMGAIQAQEYTMAKWAIGIRMKCGSLQEVERALAAGEIIRTHIMRPTWHFVVAKDLRWMLQLSGRKIGKAYDSYAKILEIPEDTHKQCSKVFERILRDNNHLTREEIGVELSRLGLPGDTDRVKYLLTRAESAGLVCSGADKNKKKTYALLDERVPPTPEMDKDEALATLARRYFSSHSPAGFDDFLWWSGLTITETRRAIGLIENELVREKYSGCDVYIHESWTNCKCATETVHLLPSFDEYLISYKERSAALDPKYYPKAFTRFGIFYPVIMYNGKVVGNWKRTTKKGMLSIETSLFEKSTRIDKTLMDEAEKKYLAYLST